MKKRLSVIAFVIVVLITVVVGALRFINTPSEGTISQPVPVTPPQVSQIPVEGVHVHFTYPSNFTPTATDKPVAPVLETFSFVKRQTNPWTISIMVTHLASGSLSDDSSYNYRQRSPERFTKGTQTIANQTLTVFTDTAADTYSRTAYLQHGSTSAAITISGTTSDDGNASIDRRLATLVGSWQWQ